MTDRSLLSTAVFSLILVMAASSALAQAPAIEWQRALGGTARELGMDAVSTSDGGYLVVSATMSNDGDVSGNHGIEDAWVAKVTATGTIQWQNCYGDAFGDDPYAVESTPDGGWIVAGLLSGPDGTYDAWLLKLDPVGAIEWQNTYGGSAADAAHSVQPTNDGGYIFCGWTSSNDGDVTGWHPGYSFGFPEDDAWVVKVDVNGDIEWAKAFGGSLQEEASRVQQTSDGGYIFCGWTSSNDGDVTGMHGGIRDAWIVKLADDGSIQWSRALGGTGHWEGLFDVRELPGGGFLLVGEANSSDGDVSFSQGAVDAWVVSLDAAGAINWERSLGGTNDDIANSLELTSDDGSIIAGVSKSGDGDLASNYGDYDYWVVKLDADGTLAWQRNLGGPASDVAQSVLQTDDGGYLVTGRSRSNANDVTGNHGDDDLWLVKLAPDAVGIEETSSGTFSVSPSPATSEVRLSIGAPDAGHVSIIDQLGRIVFSTQMTGANLAINVSAWPRGLYQITRASAEGRRTERVVLE